LMWGTLIRWYMRDRLGMGVEVYLKSSILRLLKEDEEFRYAVAGLIGLEEILRRLDRHGEFTRLGQGVMKGFEMDNG